ncbi:MAG: hypothetical protein M3P51_15890 [Chloroflexota bacterium]|nr:hypothetical protein [Chloroflexota bacterium]
MSRVIPTTIIERECADVLARIAATEGLPFSEQTVVFLRAQLALLDRMLDAGEASADDQLDRGEAMEWSGLGKDALDAYPHVGSYTWKRWRRGDLTIREPRLLSAVDAQTGAGRGRGRG